MDLIPTIIWKCLTNPDIIDKVYQTYFEDLKEKIFPNKWKYLKYYNFNDI
jgi:hypothetical protein